MGLCVSLSCRRKPRGTHACSAWAPPRWRLSLRKHILEGARPDMPTARPLGHTMLRHDGPMEQGEVAARLGVTTGGSIKFKTREYLASQHLWAALYTAQQCADFERRLHASGSRRSHPTQRALASSSIVSSVAFLEALVNETYEDAVEVAAGGAGRLDETCRTLMREYWLHGGDKASTLTKYQMALVFARLAKFDVGAMPYQDVATLISLRNAFVHYRPAWRDDEAPPNLEAKLLERVSRSPLLGAEDASSWMIWALASPTAEWSVRAARALADEWCNRMQLNRTYDEHLSAYASDR